jgi:hypothetical protein
LRWAFNKNKTVAETFQNVNDPLLYGMRQKEKEKVNATIGIKKRILVDLMDKYRRLKSTLWNAI